MEIRDTLLRNVRMHPNDLVAVVAKLHGLTIPAVHRHLRRLIDQGAIRSTGSRKYPRYELALLAEKQWVVTLAGLAEDRVWRDQLRTDVARVASPTALGICEYAFTEILNNAIDHSEGHEALVRLEVSPIHIRMAIADDGIGIFRKISRAFSLEDPRFAILELAKGKVTTDPSRHTGEGIYFTSRAMDTFEILSGNLYFGHSIKGRDYLLRDSENADGTIVFMTIDARSTRELRGVFSAHANLEAGFARTIVPVALAQYGEENLISRSQAKRLLAGLDRFREVVLDFENVQLVGQGFADEVFRVFASGHPEIHLGYVGANSDIERMIKHVLAGSADPAEHE